MRPVVFRRLVIVSAVLALSVFLPPTHAQQNAPPPRTTTTPAQDWRDDIPAHLAFVDGSVTLERDGRLEPAETNLALMAGDRIRTQTGRVEIRFEDGSALYLDESAQLDLLGDGLARLIEGQLRLAITRATTSLEYRIDTPAASVWIHAAGEYRLDAYMSRERGPETDLMVIRGTAELENDHGRTTVRSGQHAVASIDAAPTRAYATNSAAWDEFDRWTEDQRDVSVGTVSTRYLPDNVRYYSASFDQYGTWDYDATYGPIWYPRVAPGWRPYSQGRWSFTGHFGWMWVGIDRWSWPTHHYGSWGISAGGWYWIPGSRWAPAWVSWGGAPGYVSWCPLGYNGRPVVGFYARAGYAYNPWDAWTIVPAPVFGPGLWVSQHVVAPHRIAPNVRAQFVERPGAPRLPMTTSARNIEPVRAPTAPRNAAVPRRTANDGASEMRGNSPRPSRAIAPAPSGAPSVSSPSRVPTAVPRTWEIDAATSAASSSAGPIIHRGTPGSASQGSTAEPETTGRAAVGRSRVTTSPPGRVEAPRVDAPRSSPRMPIDPGSTSSDAAPPISVYRGRPAPPTVQPAEEPPAQEASRVQRSRVPSNDAARPSAPQSPPAPSNSGQARGRMVDRSAPPPPSAAPPPSAGEPPSRGRGGESTPPPSAGPPSSRGGPAAVPRARGGSGGN